MTVEGPAPLKERTATVENSDWHFGHDMAIAPGASLRTVGAFIKPDAPPLVTTSARPATVTKSAAITRVIIVFISRLLFAQANSFRLSDLPTTAGPESLDLRLLTASHFLPGGSARRDCDCTVSGLSDGQERRRCLCQIKNIWTASKPVIIAPTNARIAQPSVCARKT